MTDNEKKMSVKEEIDELTALAIHRDKGYDLDACRTDAIMQQALWEPKHAIQAIVEFLSAKFDKEADPTIGTTTNGKE